MFGRKGKAKAAAAAEVEELAATAPVAARSDDDEEDAALVAKPTPAPKSGGLLKTIIGLVVVTLIAAGGGVTLGTQTGAAIERAIAAKDAQAPVAGQPLAVKYSGDMLIKTIEPVITNLASPADTWVRLETAMVFKNGTLANPEVTAAQIRQDEVAYLRTISLSQLEGPSALQHLREDLNERAALRTGGKVTELVIQTLIVQ